MSAHIPTHGEISAARERLGLSVSQFADALGFAEDGGRTVRSLETGMRNGKPYQISGTAAAALRYLEAIHSAILFANSHLPESAIMSLRDGLPEFMQ